MSLFDVAQYSFPKMCTLDNGTRLGMIERISNIEISRGGDWASYYTDDNGEWGCMAEDRGVGDFGGFTMFGAPPGVVNCMALAQDAAFLIRWRFPENYTLVDGRVTILASIGNGTLTFRLIETASNWKIRAIWPSPTGTRNLDSVTYTTLTGTNGAVLNWDADGNKDLYVNGTFSAADTTTDDWNASIDPIAGYVCAAHAEGVSMQQAGWDRLLSPAEISVLTTNWDAAPQTVFDYVSDAAQVWTVPVGVTRAQVSLTGATGSTNNLEDYAKDGLGQQVVFEMLVTEGEQFDLYVARNNNNDFGAAGWPGGGAGGVVGSGNSDDGHGGGGFTGIADVGSLDHTECFALGGGGGGGSDSAQMSGKGGDAGYPDAGDSTSSVQYRGYGATALAGGLPSLSEGGTAGVAWLGGNGQGGGSFGEGGGGGGGGRFGGGGGGGDNVTCGGGGGGTSWYDTADGRVINFVAKPIEQKAHFPKGQAVIKYL